MGQNTFPFYPLDNLVPVIYDKGLPHWGDFLSVTLRGRGQKKATPGLPTFVVNKLEQT